MTPDEFKKAVNSSPESGGSSLWSAALIAVFVPTAVCLYRRKVLR